MSAEAIAIGKQKLEKIPDVDIDASGKFKYVLVKVYNDSPELKDLDVYKYVVRGYADCPFHADVYDRLIAFLNKLDKGYDSECIGGGRILREGNTIKVFGYSQGYGRADHSITVDVLKKNLTGYEISWSDEGY